MALPFVRICWHIHLPFFLCKAWVICLGYYGALQLVKLVQVLIYRPNSRGVHPPTPLALHSAHFCTIFQNIQQRDDRMQYTAEWHDIQQSDRIYGVKHQVRFSGISPFEHFQKFSFPFTFFQSLQVGQNFNITFSWRILMVVHMIFLLVVVHMMLVQVEVVLSAEQLNLLHRIRPLLDIHHHHHHHHHHHNHHHHRRRSHHHHRYQFLVENSLC